MKKCLLILLAFGWSGMLHAQTGSLLPLVQPLTGTANSTTAAALKHGAGTERLANTIPAVGVPFGMTQWTPQTRTSEQKCLAPYYYKDTLLSGFRGSHWLSGSCTQDYGSVTIMPLTGHLRTRVADFATTFSHRQETAAPDYYRVQLTQYGITAEMTALARSSLLQFTLQRADSFYLLVMPNSDQQQGFVQIDAQRQEISGYNPAHRIYQGWGQPAGFSGYFVVQVERPFSVKGTFSNGDVYTTDSLGNRSRLGAYIGFKAAAGERVRIRVGTSFTSIAAARRNLQAEINTWELAVVRRQCARTWESALGKIKVAGDSTQQRIFYTALYHSLQHPRTFNDADGAYPRFAQQYRQARLGSGNYYDDFSMWDIYRAQLPLLEILDPQRVNDMVRSLVRKGQDGGWLPIFPCWNSYTGAMIGDHATAFIASAWQKGIRQYDAEAAYALMRRNAFETPARAAYVDGKGRRALASYLRYGYIPLEDSVPDAFHKKEQVSRTLEYAYDDYALALMAKALGKQADHKLLLQRSRNYRHVFDTATGFVRGRYANGGWYTPFDPDKKMPFITEGTPRQYTFYVPHDIPGLAALMGGQAGLETALDSLFAKGEYWHGNEPGHQVPFLYNYTAAPWKTQREVRRILQEEYADGPGGLSGNDDAGQMSAWYVFAAMGMYPVDPVSGAYALCVPLFDQVTLQLPDHKKVSIQVHRPNPAAAYIDHVTWNGSRLGSLFIAHRQLAPGGRLEIWLK
ncbi:GH92 family glycosyl hydrolase [Chitinophaga japonensis]|uniref:Putative alpha-1,2-mannosidase n=1 Tax=Chitinophaga japonensis TaxID=104662 RepID=A0A562T5V7_CHIJA|nr:GH92 family glycosyl hydrolase [Chitinophaga japonensis]TWI88390.1 putative alpha-1,2-mannosidase [Chitinophaga japonensis]